MSKSNSTELKIAAIQMVSTASLQENLETARRLIKAAAHDGAQITVLPEYFCIMGLKDTDKVNIREKLGSGPIQEALATIARDSGIYLIAGTIPLEAKDHWEILLRARAIENQCYVLASAQGGVHQNQRRTWGNSMLIDPWGDVLVTLAEGEGFISGTLSKDKLNEVRSKLPALAHRKL